MLQLDSKNYDYVDVEMRGDDGPTRMPVSTGLKLMEFLTASTANHVQITNMDGDVIVVRTTDITRVTPIKKSGELKKYV